MALVRIHPDNPKLFEFRGRPLVLLTATEHYGAVLNRPFRFERYLRDAAANGMTLTRLFTLFRELQTPINPASTCKPASPDYLAPYARTGPGFALDGEPRFDLDRDDPEFYERMHRFIGLADELGVVVEVVLLSNTYGDPVWRLNPLHALNNVNELPACPAPEYLSMRHPALFERQRAHVRRIVEETRGYDNVVYEICNEPGGRASAAEGPMVDEVNEWLDALIAVVREADHPGERRHLIAGQEAFVDKPFLQTLDHTYDAMDYDVVNVHPLPATRLRGADHHLGTFMSKQLRLAAFRDMTLAAWAESKPLNHDEDNVASQYRDPDGWTVHRKRAWVALLCGAHYDVIDFSIQPFLEEGTPDAQHPLTLRPTCGPGSGTCPPTCTAWTWSAAGPCRRRCVPRHPARSRWRSASPERTTRSTSPMHASIAAFAIWMTQDPRKDQARPGRPSAERCCWTCRRRRSP